MNNLEQMIINKVELDPELMEKREVMYQRLAEDQRVLDFLEHNHLDLTFLKANVQRFFDWTKELDLKTACESSENCLLANGYYEDLIYDGLLQKVITPCVHTLKQLQKDELLSNYIVMDIPETLATVTMADIVANPNEDLNYIRVVREVSEYLNRLDGTGYYLYGDVGVGKTYLLSAITNEIVKQGKKVAFVHTPTLSNNLKNMISRRESLDGLLSRLKHVDVLVLDDIGTEGVSDWLRDDILLSILNYRMDTNKTCFFTSNLSMAQLEEYYSVNNRNEVNDLAAKRLMERIRMTSKEVRLLGNNRRIYVKGKI